MHLRNIIIDYGVGNSASVLNMLKKIGYDAQISSDLDIIANADTLFLPGIGAFKQGMKNLSTMGILPILTKKVLEDKTPILGICLGMQLFAKHSEEGNVEGLSFLDAKVMKFRAKEQNIKVPHMGWNTVEFLQKYNTLLQQERYYFVHSYYVECGQQENILAVSNYKNPFVAAIIQENIVGVQFHPEKSHRFGMRFLKTYMESLQC